MAMDMSKAEGAPARSRRWHRRKSRCRDDSRPMRCSPMHAKAAAAAAAQHHPEDLSRRGAGAAAARHRMADCGFIERLVVFWSNHFCISANKGGLARMWAGSFEREAIRPACVRPLRRHAEGGRAASGDAVLSRQPAVARTGLPRRAEPQPRPERKSRARDHGAAYARRRRRLFAGRRDLAGAHHHRLDLCRTAGPARHARHLCLQRQCA